MSTDISTSTAIALDAVKQRHRAVWASGDYPAVAREVIADLGPALVHATRVRVGDRVLDVAAGSGNAAIPAALRGARVIASDLTPELFAAGRDEAERVGAELEWHQADAEALPYGDSEFDATISCVGTMFAPRHQVVADEMVRVTRPGGRLGVLSWTPEGFIGQMFAVMKPYAPAPPPGAQPPPLWGDPDHVSALFGERVADVGWGRHTLRVDTFDSALEFREFFKRCYGPTIATYRHIADDPGKVADLDRDLLDLAQRHLRREGGRGVMQWEYLLFTARRATS